MNWEMKAILCVIAVLTAATACAECGPGQVTNIEKDHETGARVSLHTHRDVASLRLDGIPTRLRSVKISRTADLEDQLDYVRATLGLIGTERLSVHAEPGGRQYFIRQRIDGLPVLGEATIRVLVSKAGMIELMSGGLVIDTGHSTTSSMKEHQAVNAVLDYVLAKDSATKVDVAGDHQAVQVFYWDKQTLRLAWHVVLKYQNGDRIGIRPLIIFEDGTVDEMRLQLTHTRNCEKSAPEVATAIPEDDDFDDDIPF